MKFRIVSALAVGWLLGLMGVNGCGKKSPTGVTVDTSFRPYISADTLALLSIQLDKLEATAVYKRHENEFGLPRLDAMAVQLGLNPRRDISSALAVWDGKHALLLAHGSFSTNQVEQRLRGQAERSSYKDFTIYNRQGESVAFPDKGLAIAGSDATVRSALDARGSGTPDELEQRLRNVPKGFQIWEVSRGALPLDSIGMRADLQSALSNIVNYVDGTSLAVGLDSGSHLKAEISCTSTEGAQRVHDAMRGLIGLGRLSTNDSELDLLRMWDAISVDQDRQLIRIHADLPEDLTDKLLTHLRGLRGQVGSMLNRQ